MLFLNDRPLRALRSKESFFLLAQRMRKKRALCPKGNGKGIASGCDTANSFMLFAFCYLLPLPGSLSGASGVVQACALAGDRLD
jgi:hypothetical protein